MLLSCSLMHLEERFHLENLPRGSNTLLQGLEMLWEKTSYVICNSSLKEGGNN